MANATPKPDKQGGIDDGGPAFPVPVIDGPDLKVSYPPHVRGMSLRDWFAGKALTGLTGLPDYEWRQSDIPKIAEQSYRFADAMLAARGATM